MLVSAKEIALGCSGAAENGDKKGWGRVVHVVCLQLFTHNIARVYEATVVSALSFCLPLYVPPVINCEVLQNLHPAPFQMCLTASLGHRQRCLSCRYRAPVDLL